MDLFADYAWRDELRDKLADLAKHNVYVGTSSWKYPGWCGRLYDTDRYLWRNKFSESRFNKTCLAEYAEVFKGVGVDAGYYRFPAEEFIAGIVGQVPSDFKFAFKVTDEITIKRFTKLPRHGDRAGKPNENFLNARLFANAFLKPLEPHRKNVGLLMFEFSTFYKSDFARGLDFVEQLDGFFAALPPGWQYGVELRNENFLQPEYFECLARHGIAHVYNSWQRMPSVADQMQLVGHRTNPDFAGARFLLKPGRAYAEAVERFSPYAESKEIHQDIRDSGTQLIDDLIKTSKKPSFVLVNNRLEGNAIETIRGMLGLSKKG